MYGLKSLTLPVCQRTLSFVLGGLCQIYVSPRRYHLSSRSVTDSLLIPYQPPV
jgi:hypothetical protein